MRASKQYEDVLHAELEQLALKVVSTSIVTRKQCRKLSTKKKTNKVSSVSLEVQNDLNSLNFLFSDTSSVVESTASL